MKSTFRIGASGLVHAVVVGLLLCVWTPLGAQSPTCAPIYGVMARLFDTPFHLYMIDSAQTDAQLHGGTPRVSEEIWSGNVMYIMTRGKWMKSPIDVAAMRKSQKEHVDADTKATCTPVRDEDVTGEPAALWTIHSVTEYGTSETNAWVSKRRNLIVQSDVHLDVGGALGKSHTVQRYEYSNVHAPAGVQ
jgi:hypothetical protein